MTAIFPEDGRSVTDLVRAYARVWAPGATLNSQQIRRLRRAVLTIGAAQGVIDPLDRAPIDPGTLPYQAQVIAARISALLGQGFGLQSSELPRFGTAASGSEVLPGVVPAVLVRALDANGATASDLAALPGLGPVSARRLVARRSAQGLFSELDEVRRAARISGAAFDRVRPFLFLGKAAPPPIQSVAVGTVRFGGLTAYLEAWQAGALMAPHLDGLDLAEAMVIQAEHCARSAHAAPAVPRLWAPSRRRLREGSRALRRGEEMDAAAVRDTPRVAPVFSSGYLPLLLNLIDTARTEITASMFYFTVGAPESDDDPGDKVVNALSDAQRRGVVVRIILDDDLAPDLHGARLVNEDVFELLEARRVPFRRDHYEVTSHAKMIVLDRARVLVGSHNWTASAFFRYQETSLLIDNPAFGEEAASLLDRRWTLLAPPDSRIVPVERLESLSPDELLALEEEGLSDGPDFLEATRLKADRLALGARANVSEARLDRTRRIVNLMQSYPISETMAYALVEDGLDAPSEVARASVARLQRAFLRLERLPPPFAYRDILPQTAEWLAEQEAQDG